MDKPVKLRGMTWDHARGYDPMVATSDAYMATHPGVEISWEKRSLQAFADRPIADMAADYDLMVIDHPHVGEVAESGQLLALDRPAVVFTHVLVINAVVGQLQGSEATLCCWPDNGSITHLRQREGRLELVALGAQMATLVT